MHAGIQRPLVGVVTLVAALALAACSEKHSATQSLARVNSGEITVLQLNQLLEHNGPMPPDQTAALSRNALERLIDQELAVQQATEQKLDREPRVMSAIEAAKREILARAYFERTGAQLPKPGADEIQQYFDAHPGLFSQRRVYTLREIVVTASAAQRAEVEDHSQSAKTPEEFEAWLKAQGLSFNGQQSTRPAEALPVAAADKLVSMSAGQSLLLPRADGVAVFFLLSAKSAPVNLEQGRGPIEQYLMNERRRKAIGEELKRLRSAAKIEYLGQFAASAASDPAEPLAPAASDTSLAAPVATPIAAPAVPAPVPSEPASGMSPDIIKKGLNLK